MVSDFVNTKFSYHFNSQVKFNIYARKDVINQTKIAKAVGRKALKYYEYYFNINFPMSKIDFVAVPDFRAGAMENWGLINFRYVYKAK